MLARSLVPLVSFCSTAKGRQMHGQVGVEAQLVQQASSGVSCAAVVVWISCRWLAAGAWRGWLAFTMHTILFGESQHTRILFPAPPCSAAHVRTVC